MCTECVLFVCATYGAQVEYAGCLCWLCVRVVCPGCVSRCCALSLCSGCVSCYGVLVVCVSSVRRLYMFADCVESCCMCWLCVMVGVRLGCTCEIDILCFLTAFTYRSVPRFRDVSQHGFLTRYSILIQTADYGFSNFTLGSCSLHA